VRVATTAPEPVVRVAIEARTSADRDRLGVALGRMVAADPSLRIESDGEIGQTLLAGMGQLHLEISVERLATEHRVSVTTGRPLVAYRSTIRRVPPAAARWPAHAAAMVAARTRGAVGSSRWRSVRRWDFRRAWSRATAASPW
jgi:translation elongation factor EF-4